MNFGSYMGKCLTSSDEFDASLIIRHKKPIPINFDNLELESYIEGYQLRIRLGIENSPGSRNELTLEADQLLLKPGVTYPIGPKSLPVRASFGLEGYVEHLPSIYWGNLDVNNIYTDKAGKTSINVSFSIGWDDKQGKEMEIKCSMLQVST
ncbi:hypothetical protein [Pseudomonas sp. O39]|uniref:hypothetical protein n=1 Tax=Pseudomonas sp. O39 TaxID=3379130 RepID=UPI00387B9AEA